MGQQSKKEHAAPRNNADSSMTQKSQTTGNIQITKVSFVSSYQLVREKVTAQPGKVIAVIQTNREFSKPFDVMLSLSNYTIRYNTSDSKTGVAPAIAVGNQHDLPSGEMMQAWCNAQSHTGGQSLVADEKGNFKSMDGKMESGIVEHSRYISGLTILVSLPENVSSFTISIKDIAFVSHLIQRFSADSSSQTK